MKLTALLSLISITILSSLSNAQVGSEPMVDAQVPPIPVKKSVAMKNNCASNLNEIQTNDQLKSSLGKFLLGEGKLLKIGDTINFGAGNSQDRVTSLNSCCKNQELVNPESVLKIMVAQDGSLKSELGGNVGAATISKICFDGKGVSLKFKYPRRVYVSSIQKHVDAEALDFQTRLEKTGKGRTKMFSTFTVDKQSYRYGTQGMLLTSSDGVATSTKHKPAAAGIQ